MPRSSLTHSPSGPVLCIEPCFNPLEPKTQTRKEANLDQPPNDSFSEEQKSDERDEWDVTVMLMLLQLVKTQTAPSLTIRFGRFELEGVLKFRSFHNEDFASLNLTEKLLCVAWDPTIISLYLQNQKVNDAVAIALSTSPFTTTLDLASNMVSAEGAKALSLNTTITSLNLRCNKIGAEGAEALSCNTTITSLDLKSNNIGDEGAKALSHNTTITSLDLNGNRIEAAASERVEQQINNNKRRMEERRDGFCEIVTVCAMLKAALLRKRPFT